MEKSKLWLERLVSSESVGEAMEKTLDFMVDGDWNFSHSSGPVPAGFNRELPGWSRKWGESFDAVQLKAELRNAKSESWVARRPNLKGAYFLLTARAIFKKPTERYDSVSGDEDMRIEANFYFHQYEKEELARTNPFFMWSLGARNIKGGTSSDRHPMHNSTNTNSSHGQALVSPLELGKWVNLLVERFKDNWDGDQNDEEPVEPSPETEPVLMPTFGEWLHTRESRS
jgi:hypothetical protein